jgi:hypothetical protein
MRLRAGSEVDNRDHEPRGRERPAAPSSGSDPGRELAEIGVRLLDDAYLTWCRAARDSELALSAWREDTACSDAQAYCAYRAALEREDAAARDLERLSELTRPCQDALAAG